MCLHTCSCVLPHSATIELIQLDSSGEPLSIGETLNNLKAIAEQLEKSGILPGIEVESVTAINPSEHSGKHSHLCPSWREKILQLSYILA